MEKSDFDGLLERYLKGEVTERERSKLEAWLDAVKTNVPDGLELDPDTEDALFKKITSSQDNAAEIVALVPKREPSIPRWASRVAAAILIVVTASYAIQQLRTEKEDTEVFGANNGVEKRILSDGTLVWLRGDSRLVFRDSNLEANRYGELRGEALFEVAKNASRPFILRCHDVVLQVLGTSFSVKTSTEGVELRVLTGKVNLSSPKNQLTIDVQPMEKVVYRNGEITKVALTRDAIESVVANTEYKMEFAGAPMSLVLRKIEKKFDVTIRTSEKSLDRCLITADLTDQSLGSTLQMIEEVLPITYSREGNLIIISGAGCK